MISKNEQQSKTGIVIGDKSQRSVAFAV